MSDEFPSNEEQHEEEKIAPDPGDRIQQPVPQVEFVAEKKPVAKEPEVPAPDQAGEGSKPKKGFVRRRDKPAFAIALVVCVATLVQVGVTACNNWSSGQQTDKLIGYAQASSEAATESAAAATKSETAAEKSAQASRDFADTSGDIKDSIDNAVTQLGKEAAETEKTRESSIREEEKSLNASIEDFHEGQRPWIEIGGDFSFNQDEIIWTGKLNPDGSPIEVRVAQLKENPDDPIAAVVGAFTLGGKFANVGNSPALHVENHRFADFVDVPPDQLNADLSNVVIPPVRGCEKGAAAPKGDVIAFHNREYGMGIWNGEREAMGKWLHGDKILVAHGCIRYTDQAKDIHQTNFCSAMVRIQKPYVWQPCAEGNDVW